MENPQSKLCNICLKNAADYKCPKCLWSYCSLSCYKNEKHSDCSEEFYRNEVFEALNQQKCNVGNQLTDLLDEISQLDIGHHSSAGEDCSRVIDIDSESLYDQLAEDEKLAFDDLLRTNKGGLVLEPVVPWWLQGDGTSEPVPDIRKHDDFTKIFPGKPSGTLIYRFVNAAFVYAYSYRLFNADFYDLPDEVIALFKECSIFGARSSGLLFENLEYSLWSTIFQIENLSSSYLTMVPSTLVLDDLESILSAHKHRMAMMSHLYEVFGKLKSDIKFKSVASKWKMSCKFYLSWLSFSMLSTKWNELISDLYVFRQSFSKHQQKLPDDILNKLRQACASKNSKIELISN